MSQLRTLIWLKWKLLRNSLRSSKAVVNKLASVLGMLAALTFSLIVAVALGVTAYAFTRPGLLGEVLKRSAKGEISLPASTEFIFFSIFGFLYLMWATVPLSIGGSKQSCSTQRIATGGDQGGNPLEGLAERMAGHAQSTELCQRFLQYDYRLVNVALLR